MEDEVSRNELEALSFARRLDDDRSDALEEATACSGASAPGCLVTPAMEATRLASIAEAIEKRAGSWRSMAL